RPSRPRSATLTTCLSPLSLHDALPIYNHGFAVDWMRKDLGICLTEAERNQAPLPLTEMVDAFYADIQAMGGGRWDTSSLLKRLQIGEHTSELQSRFDLVCRLLLEIKNK